MQTHTGELRSGRVNCAPVARAGPDQAAYVGDTIDLDGSGSSDADGDALSFDWQFISKPAGSAAAPKQTPRDGENAS